MTGLRVCHRTALLGWSILLALGLVAVCHAEWHVPEAALRFTVKLEKGPTHKAAGYFAHLPDGGVLPKPYPLTRVVSDQGNVLDSYALWHNPIGGLAIVFAPPARGSKVHVYVGKSMRLNLWTPESGLKPSAILCADPTVGSMSAAQKLGQLGSVGPTVHYRQHYGHSRAPLVVDGDHSGRPRPCAFYMLAHLQVNDPGKTWVAPFVLSGSGEVKVNGTTINPVRRIDKWGGTGAWVDLPNGLNRFELFQTAEGQGGYSERGFSGLMYMTWRPPNATMADLGGVRSKKVPMTGTSRFETRLVKKDEIAHSGSCRVLAIASQNGAPVASIQAVPKEVFWFGSGTPMIMYELSAFSEGAPAGTKYAWQFDDRGTTVSGATASWLFPAAGEHRVKLTASAAGRVSRALHGFYGHTTIRSRMRHAKTRSAFYDASLTMFEATPATRDPMVAFGEEYWDLLLHSIAVGEGTDLLHHLFSDRPQLLKVRLDGSEIDLLLDVLLDTLARRDAGGAATWIQAQKRKTVERTYTTQLSLAEAETQMHYLGNTNAAAAALRPLLSQAGETRELALIRMGDLAFLSGDLNRATAIYADVQKRVRYHRNSSEAGTQGSRGSAFVASMRKRGEVDNWKLNAFLGVSISETVKSLIDQGQMLAARETLQAWERQFPLSKVSGDYVLQEARYYIKLKDWQRARSMLEAYCDLVDASSYMPNAALELLECMIGMEDSKADIRAYCERMSERFEFHPVAKAFQSYMGRY